MSSTHQPKPTASRAFPAPTVPEALRKKAAAAERQLSHIRLAMIAFHTLIYELFMGSSSSLVWFARSCIFAAWAYGGYVHWAQPYRRYPGMGSTYFTIAGDSALIIAWICATGGFDSPFHPLLYVSMLAISLRCPPRVTLYAAVGYAAAYAALLQLLGEWSGHVSEGVTRLVYLIAIAWIGSYISREVTEAVVQRIGLEERLRIDSAFQRSQIQLAEVQAIAQLGSWEWNVSTNELTWSEELLRLFDLPPDTSAGYRDFLDRVHPDDATHCRATLRSLYETPQPFSVEHRILHSSGQVRWVHSRGRALLGSNGKAERLVGTVQDITGRKEIQERLLASDRLASLGTLAGGVAHEINNPLMYIVGNLEFLQGQLRSGPTAEAISEARQGADRVRRIVQDLKTFSHPSGNERGPAELRRALELSINMTRNEIRHRARLVTELGDLPAVAVDESRLGQVFVNLLVNAAHAIPSGDPERNEVRIVARVVESQVIVEVRDTGCGMSPEVRRHIFEPFFTTKPVGAGTGLGLAICHGILERTGGQITCETEQGRGTTFRVVLPISSEHPLGTPTVPGGSPVPRRRGLLLVVDDDPLVGTALVRALGSAHDVVLCLDGNKALDLIQTGKRFDLVLCDLAIPGSSGEQIHAQLSRFAPDQVDALVLMSTGVFNPSRRAFLDQASIRYLDKPIDPHQVHELLLSKLGEGRKESSPVPNNAPGHGPS